tara:strand:- start:4674 stop:5438 length:765 start_codon:yes stop_codon:yes gene_type:complete
MASYTEAFLDSLGRASNSLTDLMQQVKEPTYEEKVRIDTEAEKGLLDKRGEVQKDTEGYLMGQKAGFDKQLLNMENLADYEIAALNAVTSMKLGQMKGEQAMQQLHHATEQELEAAKYAAQAGVASISFDYGSTISNPEENRGEGFFGSLAGLIPGRGTYSRFMESDEKRTKQSQSEFQLQSNMLKAQLPAMLKEYKANPESALVQQYKDLIMEGLSTAEKLSENSAFQNFDDQTTYYNTEMDGFANMLDMLGK